jgi:hypothetical protein
MSTYPGEDPQHQQPAGQQPDSQEPDGGDLDDGTELTQPVGYWERQAAEQARQQTQQGDPDPSAAQGGAVFNPTTAPYEQTSYGQPPYTPYAQQPYGQPYYGQPTYGPPPPYGYPPPPHAGPPVGPHPGFGPYGAFSPARSNHPQATLSMVLGIAGLVFGFLACGIGFLAAPFAWALGRNALTEIRASQGRLGGEGTAKAGMVMGIIGTVLLALVLLGLVIAAILVAVSENSTTGSSI